MKEKRFFKGLLIGSLAIAFYYVMMVVISLFGQLFISVIMVISNPKVTEKEVIEVIEETSTTVYFISGVIIIICFFLFFKLRNSKLSDYCDIKKVPTSIAFSSYFLGFALSVMTDSLVTIIRPPQQWIDKHAESVDFKGPEIVIVLTVMILAPILEEIVFRGLFYRVVKKHSSAIIAAVLSAAIFGVIHGNKLQAIYAATLGLVLVYTYEMTQSLHAPIIMHIGFNSAGIVVYYSRIYLLPVIAQLIIAIVLTGSLMFYLYINKRKSDIFSDLYL